MPLKTLINKILKILVQYRKAIQNMTVLDPLSANSCPSPWTCNWLSKENIINMCVSWEYRMFFNQDKLNFL